MKNKKIRYTIAITMVSLTMLVFVSYKVFSQQSAWIAPPAANQKINFVTADVTNNLAGKNLYVKECSSCHGKYGKGDGPAAAAKNVSIENEMRIIFFIAFYLEVGLSVLI